MQPQTQDPLAFSNLATINSPCTLHYAQLYPTAYLQLMINPGQGANVVCIHLFMLIDVLGDEGSRLKLLALSMAERSNGDVPRRTWLALTCLLASLHHLAGG